MLVAVNDQNTFVTVFKDAGVKSLPFQRRKIVGDVREVRDEAQWLTGGVGELG